MERRQFIMGSAVAALSVSAVPIAAATATADRVEWERAMRRFRAADDASRRYNREVYDPMSARMERLEDAAGLERKNHGFLTRRKAFIDANPKLYHDYNAVGDESDRLCGLATDAEDDLLSTPAPDLAALRFKLDKFLELCHCDMPHGGSTSSWSAEYVAQTLADIARLMPPGA